MRKTFLIFLLFVLLKMPAAAQAYVFVDDFESGMDGWTSQIGAWSVYGDAANHFLKNTGSPYGTIWADNTLGVYQSIKADAYFNPNGSTDDKIAHLRVRTSEHAGATQPFWDTGYLADINPTRIVIQDCYQTGNPVLFSYAFAEGESPIDAAGWYELEFQVSGTGADTHFILSINGTAYIDEGYNNTIAELDSGYVGLGRLIRYDNVEGYSSLTAPVPEPTTLLLFGSGLVGMALRRKK